MHEDAWGGLVCGIDEAGRGPLAGPVVAACVVIPPAVRGASFLNDINDSKKLSARKRETLRAHIEAQCLCGTGLCGPEEIDSLNIHHATLLAMKRAWEDFKGRNGDLPDAALIDGRFTPDLEIPCRALVKGDSLSLSIAAASILAKTRRDRIMTALHGEFPAYGWDRNAGYGTALHLENIRLHGITPHHRRSFAPVKAA